MNTKDLTDILRVDGINSKGFGIVPVLVMQDTRLTIEAKAIYAYFASLSGGGAVKSPDIDTITTHLCISKNRYYKHLKLLKEYGYLNSEITFDSKGRYSNVLYVLQKEGNQRV